MTYWETRYARGGYSGQGSRGNNARNKAQLVNQTVERFGCESILDLGCGDGFVANLIHGDYLGVDPSPSALKLARRAAPRHRFVSSVSEPRDAHLSLDVIRHLVDDTDYELYMRDLFRAKKVVMVWSSDVDRWWSDYERERHWTPDIPEGWKRVDRMAFSSHNSEFIALLRE